MNVRGHDDRVELIDALTPVGWTEIYRSAYFLARCLPLFFRRTVFLFTRIVCGRQT